MSGVDGTRCAQSSFCQSCYAWVTSVIYIGVPVLFFHGILNLFLGGFDLLLKIVQEFVETPIDFVDIHFKVAVVVVRICRYELNRSVRATFSHLLGFAEATRG